jgi:transposase
MTSTDGAAPCRWQSDLSKKSATAFQQDNTLVVVVELSQGKWLIAGIVPGIDRHPLKKLPADENRLLALILHWRHLALKAGREVKRIVVAFEAGRDGFLAGALAVGARYRGLCYPPE